jgi:hypothetical protein
MHRRRAISASAELPLGHSQLGNRVVTMQPSTVLFLAANPLQVPALQLGEECRAIEDKVRRSKFSTQIRFRSRWAARPHDLLQALNEDDPTVLHFSGHGAGDCGLCFQSEDGSALYVEADSLAQIMKVAGSSVILVVLNACYSEVQAQKLAAHVPCVVGMPSAIGDEAAIVYASAFYQALASGRSVTNAHEQGVAALGIPSGDARLRDVDRESVPPDLSPKLLSRPDTDANKLFLVGKPTGKRPCILVLKARLEDFDDDALARLTNELRQLSGDLSLEIVDIKEGSVHVTLSISAAGANRILELRETGRLESLLGFELVELVVVQNRLAIVVSAASGQSDHSLTGLVSAPRAEPDEQSSVKIIPDSDGDIRDAFQAGNGPSAMAILFTRYRDDVARFCLRMLGDREQARDVMQQIFLEVFKRAEDYQKWPSLRTWVLSLAREVVDARKRLPRGEPSMPDPKEK